MLKLGEEQEITALGRTWKLGRLELAVIRGFRDWVRAQVGDPFADLERCLKFLDKDEQLKRFKDAEALAAQLKNFSMACPLAKDYQGTEEGMTVLTKLLLHQHHPGTTDEEAFAVALAISEKLKEVMEKAQGNLPNGAAPAAAQELPAK